MRISLNKSANQRIRMKTSNPTKSPPPPLNKKYQRTLWTQECAQASRNWTGERCDWRPILNARCPAADWLSIKNQTLFPIRECIPNHVHSSAFNATPHFRSRAQCIVMWDSNMHRRRSKICDNQLRQMSTLKQVIWRAYNFRPVK